MKICKELNCNDIHFARGLCERHYNSWYHKNRGKVKLQKQYKSPEEAFEAYAMPVTESGCVVWMGTVDLNNYGRVHIGGKKTTAAHRYAWERVNGPIPEGFDVDHKDHCTKSCVNVDHLRLATRSQNNMNQAATRKDNKSGYRGVSWCKVMNKWDARVQGKNYGYFDDVHQAGKFIQNKRKELFGEFAGKG